MQSRRRLGVSAATDATSDLADDIRLMSSIARRESGALADLYRRHKAVVFALCMRMLRNSAEAEEVLQDIFWEAWQRGDRYDPTRGSPRAYLLQLTRSRVLDRLRRTRRREDLSLCASLERGWIQADGSVDTESDAAPFRDAFASEQRSAILRALRSLPTIQRRAVMLAFFDGLTHQEIAAVLDAPLGTVKTRIRKGLLLLRDQLVAQYDEEIMP